MNRWHGAIYVVAMGFVVACKGSEGPSCAKVASHMQQLMRGDSKTGGDLVAKAESEIVKVLEADCTANNYPPKMRTCIVGAPTESDLLKCFGAPPSTIKCPSGARLVGPRPVELDDDEAELRAMFEWRGDDKWEELCVQGGTKHGPYRQVTIADPETLFVRQEILGAYDQGEKSGPWKTLTEGRLVAQGEFAGGMRQGTHVVFDESGAKVQEATYKDDREHGAFRRWHDKDQIALEHHFTGGKRDGAFVEWYANGTKSSELAFAADVPTGKHLEWYENGKPSKQGAYADGELHGPWREWSDEGKPTLEGTYDHGTRNGTWKAYRDDGSKLSEGTYVDGERRGTWSYFDNAGAVMASLTVGTDDTLEVEENDDGMPVKIDVQAADGTRTHLEFYPSGAIKVRGGYKGEDRHGPWIELDRHGNKIVDLHYRDGKKHGAVATYHEGTSQLAEQGTMADGEWNGPWKQWFETGKLRMEGVYVSGKRDGLWTEYHPKGHKWREGRFRAGEKYGTWTTWDAYAKVAEVKELGP